MSEATLPLYATPLLCKRRVRIALARLPIELRTVLRTEFPLDDPDHSTATCVEILSYLYTAEQYAGDCEGFKTNQQTAIMRRLIAITRLITSVSATEGN